jgi:hypothetical protein
MDRMTAAKRVSDLHDKLREPGRSSRLAARWDSEARYLTERYRLVDELLVQS